MRLTDFIRENHEGIIKDWVKFASTLLPWAKGMTEQALRDHAEELLTAVVADMEAPQSEGQQAAKSQGRAEGGALARVGQKHAVQRLSTGFDLNQLVSEYRALRAGILRLWAREQGDEHSDVTRFNEAIDESLTESTVRYSEMLDHTREQFLAILGHDLRNPLGAIVAGATVLTISDDLGARQIRVAAIILNSAKRMARMVSDLLDLTRTRLGAGIPIAPKRVDLAPLCEQVLSELEAVYPENRLRIDYTGDVIGEWDSDRLTQVVSNLVANALQHGGVGSVVSVAVDGKDDAEVVLSVHNDGPRIPEHAMKQIFEPMIRGTAPDGNRNVRGLGLGLYIAREIVTAHGGAIRATSDDREGTTFTIQLPRRQPPGP
jgi:signal transduction histidine kinase